MMTYGSRNVQGSIEDTHTYISPCSKGELCFQEIPIMSRFGVNYNDVWREVSSAEFTNMAPSSEHDHESVRGLVNLIREALQVLQNPAHLSPSQISELKTKVRRLEAQLTKESTLVRRVDPAVPLYSAR